MEPHDQIPEEISVSVSPAGEMWGVRFGDRCGKRRASTPQFDRGGKYLHFAASTDIGPTLGGDLSRWDCTPTRSISRAFLRRADKFPAVTEPEAAGPVTIDFAGIEDRIIALPVPARN